jgi:hypothetical protein
MPEPRVVKLRKPIVMGTVEITELVFSPLNAGAARQIKVQGPGGLMFDMLLDVAAKCTGQTAKAINQLEGEDLDEVLDVAADFMPGGHGKAGSAQSAT